MISRLGLLALFLVACDGMKTNAPAEPSAAQSEVSVDRAAHVIADGSDAAVITVTVRDAARNPLPGIDVVISASGDGNILSTPAATDSSGVTTATLASTVAGTKTLTVSLTSGDLTMQPTVTFDAVVTNPGPPDATLSTLSASPATARADGTHAVTLTVTAKDKSGAPLVAKMVVLSVTGSNNSLQQPALATDAQGVASGTLTSTTAEAKTVSAVVDSVALDQTAAVTFVTGEAQLAFVAQPSPAPAGGTLTAIKVAIEDQDGNLITTATDSITLTIGDNPSSGMTARLGGTLTVAAVGGVATFADLHIDRVGSGYTLVASAAGLTSATSSAFDITLGVPAQLVFSAQPLGAKSGFPLAAVTVTVEDEFGNALPASTNPVTLAIGSNPSGGVLSGTKTVAAVGGVASFADLSIDKKGAGFTLTASAAGLVGATSTPFTISGAPVKLGFQQQPTAISDNANFSPQVTVAVEDVDGVTVPDATDSIHLVLATNPTGADLLGVNTVAAVSGVATFDLGVDIPRSGYTLKATASGLTTAVSSSFDVGASAPTQILFRQRPLDTLYGALISPPPVTVEIDDASFNTITGATNLVTISIGDNPSGGVLSGTTTVAAVDGVATFNDLSIDKAGIDYTLVAQSTGLTGDTSTAFNITPGPTTHLVITSQPFTSQVGPGAVQITVEGRDVNEAPAYTDYIPVTIAFGNNPSSAVLQGMTTKTFGGSESFSFDVYQAGTGYTLVVSSPGLPSVTSSAFDLQALGPSEFVFTTQPVNSYVNELLPPVVLEVTDGYGNPTPLSYSPTIFINVGPNGAVLSGTLTRPFVGATVTFDDLRLDTAGNNYQLSIIGSNALSNFFTISNRPPTHLVFTQQPSASTIGAAIAPAVTVAIENPDSTIATGDAYDITLSLGENPAGAALSGTRTVRAVSGVATFGDLSLDKIGSGYTLGAATANSASALSGAFDIRSGAAAKLVFTRGPGDSASGAAISPSLTVAIEDSAGNLVASSTDNVTLTFGANPGAATLGGSTTVAAAGGIATFSNLSVSAAGSGYTLSASDGALTAATSGTFNVYTLGTAAGLAFLTQPSDVPPQATLLPALRVAVVDAGGHTVTSANDSITLALANNPAGATLSGTLSVAAVNGVATFSDLSLDQLGDGVTLSASDGGFGKLSSAFDVALFSASDGLGHLDNGLMNFSRAGMSDQPFASTLNPQQTLGLAIDHVRHLMYLPDQENNRVLVYALSVDDDFTGVGRLPIHVLGQKDFVSQVESIVLSPSAVALDVAGQRLFVSSTGQSMVLIYDVSNLVDNMAPLETVGSPGIDGFSLLHPTGLAYQDSTQRLFVADSDNNRVQVFDTTHPGGNYAASFSLGTGSTTPITAAGFNRPTGLGLDDAGQRLFVADSGNNRVLEFDLSSLQSGQSAIHELGQIDFDHSTGSQLVQPTGLSFDAANNRLMVVTNSDLVVFDASTISDGMAASLTMGFGAPQTSASDLDQPSGLGYDSFSNELFVIDSGNHRVLVYPNAATLSDGESATDGLGHLDAGIMNFTRSSEVNDTASFPALSRLALDATRHRLYVISNGLSIFNLSDDNDFSTTDRLADYHLSFAANGVAVDEAGQRLFVSTPTNNEVLIYDSSALSNDMVPVHHLGGLSSRVAQNQLGNPQGLAFDAIHNRLFVADTNYLRVLEFDTSVVTDGMNASHVLGQPDFVTSNFNDLDATTVPFPRDLAYDAVHERLFVADDVEDRIVVFDVAPGTIANGMSASHVLGQANFNASGGGQDARSLRQVAQLAYDGAQNRLYASDRYNDRVLLYDLNQLADGMAASSYFGAGGFVSPVRGAGPSALDSPSGLALAAGGNLFVADSGNFRVLVFALP